MESIRELSNWVEWRGERTVRAWPQLIPTTTRLLHLRLREHCRRERWERLCGLEDQRACKTFPIMSGFESQRAFNCLLSTIYLALFSLLSHRGNSLLCITAFVYIRGISIPAHLMGLLLESHDRDLEIECYWECKIVVTHIDLCLRSFCLYLRLYLCFNAMFLNNHPQRTI